MNLHLCSHPSHYNQILNPVGTPAFSLKSVSGCSLSPSFSYYSSVKFFLSCLSDSSLQRSKYLVSRHGWSSEGKWMFCRVLWGETLLKVPRPIRLSAYLPAGKGRAIYGAKMINIPRASSEVTMPHSILCSLSGFDN